MWKIADVTPLPKVKQVTDPKKELRPISLTSTLSKISEDFIVSDLIKPTLERSKKSVDIWKTIGIVLGCETGHIRSFLANFMSGLDNNLLNAQGKFKIQISIRAGNLNLW